uniref:Bcl-2-related ovarian killer protein homolog A n=1 Tax=Caligus rogercresseyi TaxID=217165 RepID=C1BRB5_CALRO|nr:Bcl-2-related ovarian killer protein homolog A [Caligus rogercresseyi]
MDSVPPLPQRRNNVHSGGPSVVSRARKMSFPVSAGQHPSGIQPLGSTAGSPGLVPFSGSSNFSPLDIPDLAHRRIRRFSNVSDAVSRKLSTTIGWRTVSVTDIVNQAKSLCSQYIRCRLKRSGLFNRKLGLQRLRSMANVPGGIVVCEVFGQLQSIGIELERLHPKLYTGVCRQVSVTITSEKSVRGVLSSVARELFKFEVSWGKIVSLYCVAGGLAVDCVRQGHPEYLFGLIDAMGLVVERDIANWIGQQGGWTALLARYRPPDDDSGVFQMIALSVVCLIALLVGMIFVLRTIGKIAFGTFASFGGFGFPSLDRS